MSAVQARMRKPVVARWMLVWLSVLMLALPALTMAQAAPQVITPADQSEIMKYSLNEDVLDRLSAVTSEGNAMQIKKAQMDMTKVHSLDDLAGQMVANDSRIKPLLSKHGFTPHEFLVANFALVNAAMAANMRKDPEMAKHVDASKVNEANVSFYTSHEAAINQMMRSGHDTSGK